MTMATPHEEFDDLVSAYALGALDAAEKSAFEAHLATCAVCDAELRQMQRVVIGIGLSTADPVDPPASLKARVLANAAAQGSGRATDASPAPDIQPKTTTPVVLHDRPRPTAWNALALAASLTLAVAAGIYAWSLRTQVQALRETVADASAQTNTLRGELAAARRDAAALRTTIRVLSAPDMMQVSLKGQGPAPNAIARGFWSRSQGLLFNAEGLPPIDLTKVYQLWVVKGGRTTSGGVFTIDANGVGSLMVLPSLITEPPDALAVSLERAGGVPVREGEIVLLGSSSK